MSKIRSSICLSRFECEVCGMTLSGCMHFLYIILKVWSRQLFLMLDLSRWKSHGTKLKMTQSRKPTFTRKPESRILCNGFMHQSIQYKSLEGQRQFLGLLIEEFCFVFKCKSVWCMFLYVCMLLCVCGTCISPHLCVCLRGWHQVFLYPSTLYTKAVSHTWTQNSLTQLIF